MKDEIETLGRSANAYQTTIRNKSEDYAREFAGSRVKTINETTKKLIARAVAKGISKNESVDQIADRIRKVSKSESAQKRARVIAVTETSRAANFAITEGHRIAGVLQRAWVTQRDGKVRPSHQALDGQVRRIDEPFVIGFATAMHPGAFSSPGESVNCRCFTRPVAKPKAATDPTISDEEAQALWEAFSKKLQRDIEIIASSFTQAFESQGEIAIQRLRQVIMT